MNVDIACQMAYKRVADQGGSQGKQPGSAITEFTQERQQTSSIYKGESVGRIV